MTNSSYGGTRGNASAVVQNTVGLTNMYSFEPGRILMPNQCIKDTSITFPFSTVPIPPRISETPTPATNASLWAHELKDSFYIEENESPISIVLGLRIWNY
jgi:hypothetical protein